MNNFTDQYLDSQRTDNRLGQTTPQIFLSFFAHVDEYYIKIEEAKSKMITKTEAQMDINSVEKFSLEPIIKCVLALHLLYDNLKMK